MKGNESIIIVSRTSIIKRKPVFLFFSLSFSFHFSSAPSSKQESEELPSHNLSTCITSLQSCAHHKDITKGKQLHGYMLRSGLINTSLLSITSLINMYSKSNQMQHAFSVFRNNEFNVFTYNAMISGFVSNGLAKKSLELFKEMRAIGVMPDRYTLPSLIKGCCDSMDAFEVKKTHGLVFKLGLDFDVYVGSALVNSYLKFLFMEDAEKVFEGLPVRDDVVLWNSMVNGYAQIGRFAEALGVYERMSKEGILMSRFTVTGILSACAMNEEYNNGRAIHGLVTKMGHDSGLAVSNALIDMYGKCKCIHDAMEVFEKMDERDIFSWNSILCVHEHCGDHDGTLMLFSRMLDHKIRPDLVTVTTVLPACAHMAALRHGREIHSYMVVNGFATDGTCNDICDAIVHNAVMDMYAKSGSMRDAHLVFENMSFRDVASWNIMIMGYGMHGYGKEALNLFAYMRKAKVNPDEVTFVGLLSACSHAGFVSEGRGFLSQMSSKYGVVPTIEHYTCVIDMLGRAGQLEEAYELAINMPVDTSSVVWRALLAGCRLHGNADLAEVVSRKIFELDPEHCGNYVLMSNVYVAAGRYDEVLDLRHTMREQNVRKIPGCSWIELKSRVHAFITRDRSHPEVQSIYDGLQLLTAHMQSPECMADIL